MNYLFIVNPLSGGGVARSRIDAVLDYFRRRGSRIDLVLTEGPGHAEKLAREGSLRGYDVIIGAGGDGTINEVINGMIGSLIKLAILPWGTGNVFAAEMGLPERLRSQCRLILKGRYLRLDVGRCGGRHFLLMLGAGFDAYSLKQLDGQALKRRFGRFAYMLAAVRAIASYSFPPIELELADGRRDTGSFVLVSNTSRYGGFLSFTPRANPLDGLLDVFVFKGAGALGILALGLRYLLDSMGRGGIPEGRVKPSRLLRFTQYRTTRLVLRSPGLVLTQLDGELSRALPAEIDLRPAAIDVILPARTMRSYRKAARRTAASPEALSEALAATGMRPGGWL